MTANVDVFSNRGLRSVRRGHHALARLLFGLALFSAAFCSAAERLQREQLLLFRTASGDVAPVKTTADWQKRRAEILAGMQAVMGPLPGPEKRVPLAVKVESETDCGSYVRREITYAAEPGARVPAFLLVPKAVLAAGQRRPGILAAMPTNNTEGNRPVVGLQAPDARPGRNYGE
jgi:hypothetical protein